MTELLQHSIGHNQQSPSIGVPEVFEQPAVPAYHEVPGQYDPYYALCTDGAIRPRDPGTGDIMVPGRIAESLLADPEIKEGMEFWRQYGHEVNFRTLMTAHETETDLEEWGIDLHAEAQRLHAAGGVLFFEGAKRGSDDTSARDVLQSAARMPEGARAEATASLDRYAAEQPDTRFLVSKAKQLIGTNVDLAFPDFTDGGKSMPDRILTVWAADFEAAVQDPSTLDRAITADLGFVPYRDMYLAGKIGAQLARRHVPGQITEAAFLGGAIHEGVGTFIGNHGAVVTRIGAELPPHARYLADCVARGELRPEDMQALTAQNTVPAVFIEQPGLMV